MTQSGKMEMLSVQNAEPSSVTMTHGRACSVDGCFGKHEGRGMCNAHYKKWKKYGDPLLPLRIKYVHRTCSIDGCVGKRATKGMCNAHYKKWKKYGDPLVSLRVTCAPTQLDLDPEWCAWFSGFAEGEAYFVIGHLGSSTFGLKLREDDKSVLLDIKEKLKVGSVSHISYSTERKRGVRAADQYAYKVNGPSNLAIVDAINLSSTGSFGSWLAGFSDAEACFVITDVGSPRFSINLRADDHDVLERIRQYLGCGSVRHRSNSSARKRGTKAADQYTFATTGTKNCTKLVGALEGKMRSKKKEDFEVWAEAVKASADLPPRSPERKPMMLEYKKKLEDIRAKGKWVGDVG